MPSPDARSADHPLKAILNEAALRTLESLPSQPLMYQHAIYLRAGYEGYVHLVQGRTAEAHRLFVEARRAVELAAPDAFRVGDRQADLVRVLVTVGELDAALVELERGLSAPGVLSVAVLRVDPVMDPLRDRPEFGHLLEKYAPQEP